MRKVQRIAGKSGFQRCGSWRALATVLPLLLLAVTAPASAQMLRDGPPPQHRVVYRNSLVLRTNPLGLLDDARISYRYRLYLSESPALRDNFIGIGLAPAASPAFGRVGLLAEFQPLSVLGFYAIFEQVFYFGGLNFLQSFPSARSEFGDALLEQRGELPPGSALRNYSTSGNQLTLGANLQLKVGPLVGRSQLRVVRPDYELREGDRVFYDIFYDVLAPDRGWFYTNDADLLYQTELGLTFGLRWTVTHAFYGPEHFEPGEPQENLNGPMHRLGPILAYTFFQKDGAIFNSPTVLLMANWWLSHRYRTGQEVSRAMPMIAAGVAFTGDLLPVK